jgi:hypothetical protein
MIDQVRLAWRLLRDDRVSAIKYLLPAVLAIYVFSPVDMVPDLFLGFGRLTESRSIKRICSVRRGTGIIGNLVKTHSMRTTLFDRR